MQGALTALNSSIIGAMRSLLAASSSSTSVPENQPPHSVTSAARRIGSISCGLLGKRRPCSMPVKPAPRDWRRHSSSDTSSLSSGRSSFHHAMGDMPSLAFIVVSPRHSLKSASAAPSSPVQLFAPEPYGHLLPEGRREDGASASPRFSSPQRGEGGGSRMRGPL